MHFKPQHRSKLKKIFLPLAWLYGLGVRLRNRLYDRGILRSASFNLPVICVGNLTVGGTGKTPMVEYLSLLLKDHWQLAILSRGYKRRSKGYLLADGRTTAADIGDEPMQFHLKFPDVTVAAGEERVVAIPLLLYDRPGTNVIILDDAFQHRAIRAGLNILLTDLNNLYTSDLFLPAGTLRDETRSANRSDLIVVTKCPPDLDNKKRNEILHELLPEKEKKVFFTTIQYSHPYHLFTGIRKSISKSTDLMLVCGIANPFPLREYLIETSASCQTFLFRDHYIYTISDLRHILDRFQSIESNNKIIITTEKDAVRLMKFKQELQDFPIYVLPMEVRFLFDQESEFNEFILNFIRNFPYKKRTGILTAS